MSRRDDEVRARIRTLLQAIGPLEPGDDEAARGWAWALGATAIAVLLRALGGSFARDVDRALDVAPDPEVVLSYLGAQAVAQIDAWIGNGGVPRHPRRRPGDGSPSSRPDRDRRRRPPGPVRRSRPPTLDAPPRQITDQRPRPPPPRPPHPHPRKGDRR